MTDSSQQSVLQQISTAGVSLWLDDLSREMLTTGELPGLIATRHIVGLTTNPAIFAAAIGQSPAYATSIAQLKAAGVSAKDALWSLMITDVQQACDAFADLYQATDGVDGRVSLEVDPELADDVLATLAMAKDLWQRVNRPNLMIKIPGTDAGLPAIAGALAEGISVNVTLIFGAAQYERVLDAFCTGLEGAAQRGHDLSTIHSVASFFVSRVDSHVDALLEADGSDAALELLGVAGLANARLAYGVYQDHRRSARWLELADLGAHTQRPLWASTGVKNPDYPQDQYVSGLVTAGVVNTVPRKTLEAVHHEGQFVGDTISAQLPHAAEVAVKLGAVGVDLTDVAQDLQSQGVTKFVQAWQELVTTVEENMQVNPANSGGDLGTEPSTGEATGTAPATGLLPSGTVTVRVGSALVESVQQHVSELHQSHFASALAAQDGSLWGTEAEAEASIRLGWLNAAQTAEPLLEKISALRDELVAEGLTRVVLCGMGGSSLAPEVITSNEAVRLTILDSTDPEQVRSAVTTGIDRTIVVVASKSGSTVETDSARRAFIAAFEKAGINPASRLVVVTDPGSPLDKLATDAQYRAVFHADPMVGGRFSALTAFGLVPSGLAGANLPNLLMSAKAAAKNFSEDSLDNAALILGAALGDPATGRTKAIIVPGLGCPEGIGHWIEQLVAESTGKNGTGVLPVVVASPSAPEVQNPQADYTIVRVVGDQAGLVTPGPGEVVVQGNLGAQFQLWATATAVCGKIFQISPFDQPDVESAKKAARGMLAEPPAQSVPSAEDAGVQIFVGAHTTTNQSTVSGVLADLLTHVAKDQGYLGVMVYADRLGRAELANYRDGLAAAAGRPVTFGWGPRFLHSTGQYHKGGPKVGCFVVVTQAHGEELPIPDQGFSFGQLISAQAQGDTSVLEGLGRPVVRLHITDQDKGWHTLSEAMAALTN